MLILELVQIGIGKRQSLSSVPKGEDWNRIFNQAQQHDVAAIVLDGINKCYDKENALDIDFQTKMEWIGLATQTESLYRYHEKSIRDLSTILKKSGYRMMVLKGYGLSLNYPVPQHRPSGDLDIWCFGKEKEIDNLMKANGIEIDSSHHHHTVFNYNDITVENHFDFVNIYAIPSSKRIEKRLKELAPVGIMENDGITLPSADFNTLFLLRHCASHFAATEMTLRQVLDWGLFMEKYHKAINWERYLPFIMQEGMFRFYNLLGLFCMRGLGFDASIFHGLYSDSLYDRFSQEIISPEFKEKENGNLFWSLWVKPRRWWHNRWKHKLCYPDSLLLSFMYGLWAKILKPSHFIQ